MRHCDMIIILTAVKGIAEIVHQIPVQPCVQRLHKKKQQALHKIDNNTRREEGYSKAQVHDGIPFQDRVSHGDALRDYGCNYGVGDLKYE